MHHRVAAIVAFGFETVGIWSLLHQMPLPWQFCTFLGWHLAACLLIMQALPQWLPETYKQATALPAKLFFFSVAFFVPGLGMPALTLVFIPALWAAAPDSEHEHWQRIGIPDLPMGLLQGDDPQGKLTGSQIAEVLTRATDAEKRLSAVMMTLRLKDRDAVPLLRLALCDAEDDVRLLAYALLDRKEQAISVGLHDHLKRLECAAHGERFILHRHIAHEYWELVHLGIVQGEILNYYLDTARHHAEHALRCRPVDSGLHLLLGRILLKTGHLDIAESAFRRAEKLGIDVTQTRAYLAEIAFLQQKCKTLPDQLPQELLDSRELATAA